MKYGISTTLSFIVAAILTTNPPVAFCSANPPTVKYAASADGAKATISGTSTLHDWTVNGTVIQGTAEFSGEWKPGADPTLALQAIDLTIPVNSLKSTEG